VWPALQKALHAAPKTPWVLEVGRDVPVQSVLRAAWAMRTADLVLQTADEKGIVRAVKLGAKREAGAAPVASACHAAAFLRSDGAVRLSSRAGPRDVPLDVLVATLRAESATCPMRYVAFGGESNDMAWGPVFDLMRAVDREKAAGTARYVLAEAIRPPPSP
jgi:hypothetical protein